MPVTAQPADAEPSRSQSLLSDPDDFTLVLGGPLFQLLRRSRLSDDALAMIKRRILAFVLVCWVPLLVLSAAQGLLFRGSVPVPFLLDPGVHLRFLVAIPILLGAELVVHSRMRSLIRQFLERNLIAERDMPRFDAALDSTRRLRNSVLAEVVQIILVYSVGMLLIFRNFTALHTTSWLSAPGPEGLGLSYAGMWFAFISLPIFQFLLFRWYFRVFVWARLLWLVSRLDLQLVASHPDRAGGIGFLSNVVHGFIPLIVAHGVLLAGLIAEHIFFLGERLSDFKLEIAVLAGFLLALVLGPLLVFTPHLAKTKRAGRRAYGTLAERYVRAFDAKWLSGGAAPAEELLGSADLQSLADLGNSLGVVQNMRMTLISKDAIVLFVGAFVAPVLPLMLTTIPVGELLDRLLGVLI
jgi:hypothetical protein